MNKLFLTFGVAAMLLFMGCADKADDVVDDDHAGGEEHMETADDMLVEQLKAHRAEFASTLEGLSDEQLNFKESEDRWSILEISEHIVKADGMVVGMLEQMMEAGPNPEAASDSSISAGQIAGVLGDRSEKYQAPDDFQPTGMFDSAAAALAAFNANQEALMTIATNADVDLTQYLAENPVFGVMDATKWITFSTSHGQRHIDQMVEVKTHENYPAQGA